MKEILDQITRAWESLTIKQRVSLLISVAATVGVVAGVVWMARQPTFTVLYTGLEPMDAQAVVQELQAAKVDYRLENGGTTVLVPYEQLNETRMNIAGKGIVSSGRFTFKELFDKDSFAESNRMHRARMQKALEDELSQTIEALDEVGRARVHLVLPGDRVFLDDDDVAKASVTLDLRGGSRPSSEQVRAIANIVAGAVPELSPDRVGVVDTSGHVLWEGDGEGGVATTRQIELKAAVEKDYNKKIGRMLEQIVGPMAYDVRTTADLDLKKAVRLEKEFDPDGGVLISEEKQKQKSANGRAGGGTPGTAANLPGTGGGRGGALTSSDEQSQQRSNFDYSYTERKIEEPFGALEKVSVAVLVDTLWETDDAGELRSVPRTPEQMTKIEELTKAAISFDEQRGDVVTVEQMAFHQTPDVETTSSFDPLSWLPLVKWPALVLLLLIGFFLFLRPTLATVKQALPAGGFSSRASAELEQPLQLGSPSRLELLRQRLNSLAAEEPEGMAQTMRVWLHEEAD